MSTHYRRNQKIMWAMFALLVFLHHDWWFWNNGTLLFGFLPIGLGYQMLISLGASALWGWAAFNAWPAYDEEIAANPPSGDTHGH